MRNCLFEAEEPEIPDVPVLPAQPAYDLDDRHRIPGMETPQYTRKRYGIKQECMGPSAAWRQQIEDPDGVLKSSDSQDSVRKHPVNRPDQFVEVVGLGQVVPCPKLRATRRDIQILDAGKHDQGRM